MKNHIFKCVACGSNKSYKRAYRSDLTVDPIKLAIRRIIWIIVDKLLTLRIMFPQRLRGRLTQSVFSHHYLVYCRNCGFGKMDPMPPKGKVSVFYNEFYQSANLDIEEIKKGHVESPELCNRVEFLLSHCADMEGSSLFDFGAGLGSFVRLIKGRRPDWHFFSTDVQKKVELLRGLDLFEEVYPEDTPITRKFDIVTATGVWEHLLEPGDTLQSFWQCVQPGGLLFIEVPNTPPEYHGVPDRMDLPHTLFYTSKSARHFFERLDPPPLEIVIVPGGRPWEEEPVDDQDGNSYNRDVVFASQETYAASGEHGRDLRVVARKPIGLPSH